MGRAAGPVIRETCGSLSVGRFRRLGKRKSRGPGGPRLGGRSWGLRPASYLLVGTPLPPTAPLMGAAERV